MALQPSPTIGLVPKSAIRPDRYNTRGSANGHSMIRFRGAVDRVRPFDGLQPVAVDREQLLDDLQLAMGDGDRKGRDDGPAALGADLSAIQKFQRRQPGAGLEGHAETSSSGRVESAALELG